MKMRTSTAPHRSPVAYSRGSVGLGNAIPAAADFGVGQHKLDGRCCWQGRACSVIIWFRKNGSQRVWHESLLSLLEIESYGMVQPARHCHGDQRQPRGSPPCEQRQSRSATPGPIQRPWFRRLWEPITW